MFIKASSKEALNSVASFYNRFSQAGRMRAEATLKGFNNPQNYRRNSLGRLVFTVIMATQWVRSEFALSFIHFSFVDFNCFNGVFCRVSINSSRMAGMGGCGALEATLGFFCAALECFDFQWRRLFTFGFGLFISQNLFKDPQKAGKLVFECN